MQLLRPAQHDYRTWAVDSRRWEGYTPRPGDIIISTSPKCGTTWTQQIISSLIFQDAKARPLNEVSPWIDARFRGPAEDMHRAIDRQHHRRFLKSHVPLNGLPLYDDVKYIFVGRDGRDVLMSLHNHFSNFLESEVQTFDRIGLADPMINQPFPSIPSDPAEYFRLWISKSIVPGQSDGLPSASLFDHTSSFWAERRRANILLVHYNDLKADLDGEMKRLATFLNIEVDRERWPSLVEAATFEKMRAAGEELMPMVKTYLAGGTTQFFYKGTNGRWRDVLSEGDLRLYDMKIREKFSPPLAAWAETGRRIAGEPAEL